MSKILLGINFIDVHQLQTKYYREIQNEYVGYVMRTQTSLDGISHVMEI